MKKNILLVTLRADWGGGPQHVDLLVNNLSEEFNIYIACPNDKPYYDKWKQSAKVKNIFVLPHRKFSFKKLIELSNFIKKNNIRIIHSHGKGAGIYSRLLKIFNFNVKVVHTLHGFHIREYNKIKKIIYIFIERLLALFTDKFINVSKGEQEICLKYKLYPVNKSTVIYNGIKQLKKIVDAKKILKLKNKFVITTISRFDYQKNMSFAYEIAKRFRDNKEIIFLWIGDGNDKKILEKQAKIEDVNIIFTGFTKDIPLYLSATDIYLSTSRWEGLPYALIEAQSLGIPIIATDVVGNNEVVIDKYNGYLFKNITEAILYINLLLENKKIYKEFSNNALKNFKNKFEITTMVIKIEQIYKDVCDG